MADKISAPEQLPPAFFHVLIYTAVTVVIIAGLLIAARWLGARHTSGVKNAPYESGIRPSTSARLALPVPFYLVAIFFIVFDVESAFIFIWAVAHDLLGLPGLIHITVFIVVLLAGLVWLWKKGALDWGPSVKARGPAEGGKHA
ncbi:MAG TPA: NADH-quinone oxidoreductase subunit A [Desulfuromonadaceae bacterium]|jgi:NADH-quinone oxidoreductase subunit A